jgi:hypothetical protein
MVETNSTKNQIYIEEIKRSLKSNDDVVDAITEGLVADDDRAPGEAAGEIIDGFLAGEEAAREIFVKSLEHNCKTGNTPFFEAHDRADRDSTIANSADRILDAAQEDELEGNNYRITRQGEQNTTTVEKEDRTGRLVRQNNRISQSEGMSQEDAETFSKMARDAEKLRQLQQTTEKSEPEL